MMPKDFVAQCVSINSPFGVDPEVYIHVGNSTFGEHFVRYLGDLSPIKSFPCHVPGVMSRSLGPARRRQMDFAVLHLICTSKPLRYLHFGDRRPR
jgi:hypothetical protein